MNLTEVLIREGAATETQVIEALDYQKRHGGRLEAHLFRFGHADERSLVNALSRQFARPGVVLSGMNIPDSIIKLIQPDVARQMLVLPYKYNSAENILNIACENPRDDRLLSQLAIILPDKTLKLDIALGPVLKCAIINFYRQPVYTRDNIAADDPNNESVFPAVELESGQPTGLIDRYFRVAILKEGDGDTRTLKDILNHQGYRTSIYNTIDAYPDSNNGKNPDLLIVSSTGTTGKIADFLDMLPSRGIDIHQTPTILISDNLDKSDLTTFLEGGLEEVISSDNIMDLLVLRLNRIRNRLADMRTRQMEIRRGLGTHGTLDDINVIDLLQAMGPTRKTARISISAEGKQLTVFLSQGDIIFAECDGLLGAEAVYQGLTWNDGVWSVDPIGEDDLPEPNNNLSNDSILLEGCRLMDEKNRGKEFSDPEFLDIFG